jgi:phosphoenolpyruvate synthase/pyruvate phosphate dikinase
VQQGIESISLNPDSVLETWLYLAEKSVAKIKG